MTLISFQPNPPGSTPQGVLNLAGQGTFDVGAALTAGSGQIVVDTLAQNVLYEALLDFPGLAVAGSVGSGKGPN